MQCKLFKVNYFTFIFIFFSIVSYHFKSVLIGYFISFIHECGHIICALVFGCKKIKIEFLPVGFFATIDNLDKLPNYKQIIVYLSGPAMFIPIYIFSNFLFDFRLISIYEFYVFEYVNKSILLFNLLTFYPLDGGRILDVILATFLDEKIVLFTRNIVNFFCLTLFVFSQGLRNNLLLSIILFVSFLVQLLNMKKEYKNFLIKRLLFKTSKKKIISKKAKIIREKDNFYLKNGKIYSEDFILREKLYKLRQ